MPKYLAINTFGLNEKEQLPASPPDAYGDAVINKVLQYHKNVIKEIGQKIVNEYRQRSVYSFIHANI
jgi:hypothetical protein